MNFKEFSEKYGVSGELKFVGEVERWGGMVRQFSVLFEYDVNGVTRELSFPFYTGPLAGADLAGALHCYAMDAASGEMDFEDFCSEFGYDDAENGVTASEAYRIWKACRDSKRDAYDWCRSEQMWDDFRMIEEN